MINPIFSRIRGKVIIAVVILFYSVTLIDWSHSIRNSILFPDSQLDSQKKYLDWMFLGWIAVGAVCFIGVAVSLASLRMPWKSALLYLTAAVLSFHCKKLAGQRRGLSLTEFGIQVAIFLLAVALLVALKIIVRKRATVE